ncbi:acyl carrier protein [Streptomyces sp. LZ34]
MTEFTIDDLRRIMRGSAGAQDGERIDGENLDADFADLGYDSLAVLEIQSQIENTFDLTLPDDALSQMRTPRETVSVVNACIGKEE